MAKASEAIACKTCLDKNIPAELRPLLPLEGGKTICGFCGKEVKVELGAEIPESLAGLAQRLLARGLFHAVGVERTDEENSPLYTLRMERITPIDYEGKWTCTLQWRSVHMKPHAPCNPRTYALALVPGHLPAPLHQAAEIISNHNIMSGGSMNLTEIAGRGANRHLKFERQIRTNSSNHGWSGQLVRCGLFWNVPDADGIFYIPVYDPDDLLFLLRRRYSMAEETERWQRLQVCCNRYTAELAAIRHRDNIHQGSPFAHEVFVVAVRCNPLAVGTALVDDKTLSLGAGSKHVSVTQWWRHTIDQPGGIFTAKSAASREDAWRFACEHQCWVQPGRNFCRIFSDLPEDQITVERLSLPFRANS